MFHYVQNRGCCGSLFFSWRVWCGALLALAAALSQAQEPLRVVTTTPDLRSLAQAVGGKRIHVVSLVPPNVDAEDYQPKPQDLNRLRDAQLLLRVGADYDLWLDKLAAQAKRAELRRGGALHVDCAFGISLLDVRGTEVGAAGGHAHGSGNPHYWLDPANAEMITAVILEALVRVDAANAKFYEAERAAFLKRLNTKMPVWEKTLAPLQGQPLIAHHNTWAYFARRFRLNFVGYIEPRAGVPASASHLVELLKVIKKQQVTLIVRQPYEPAKNAEFLARKSDAKIVLLAASVGAMREAQDYIALMDYNVATLAQAHKPQ